MYHSFSMAMQQEPIDWRYLPYVRPVEGLCKGLSIVVGDFEGIWLIYLVVRILYISCIGIYSPSRAVVSASKVEIQRIQKIDE